MPEPKITVLMPAYNAGPYIREAVDSVLAQTFTDFELLIINDGSRDETAEILSSYGDPRIRVLEQENRGLVASLNRGLQEARSEWIARFDADDVCLPERLAIQWDYVQVHPELLLLGGEADYMSQEGEHLFTFHHHGYSTAEIRELVLRECPFVHATVLFRRSAVLEAGGYDPDALTFEDHLLWRKLVALGPVENLQQPLIRVRFNPESATVDEKWRGPVFADIKHRSIRSGRVAPEDARALKSLLAGQNFTRFKKAAYHGMMGKKYLWNKHDPAKARAELRRAIRLMPRKPEPYGLYLLSFFPAGIIQWLYRRVKKSQ